VRDKQHKSASFSDYRYTKTSPSLEFSENPRRIRSKRHRKEVKHVEKPKVKIFLESLDEIEQYETGRDADVLRKEREYERKVKIEQRHVDSKSKMDRDQRFGSMQSPRSPFQQHTNYPPSRYTPPDHFRQRFQSQTPRQVWHGPHLQRRNR
jgi:hypothetical protein